MHVYREDVYFFLGGIHDGKDKKDNFYYVQARSIFFEREGSRNIQIREKTVFKVLIRRRLGWGGGGCEVPLTYNYFIVLKLISLYFIFLHVTKRGNSFKIIVSTCKLKKGEGRPTYDATCLIYTIAL